MTSPRAVLGDEQGGDAVRTYEGGATDAGRVRRNNEDYFGWRRPTTPAEAELGALYAVADGVGGEAAGEAASRLAVETFLRSYHEAPAGNVSERLRYAVHQANSVVYASAEQDHRATTLVSAAVVGDLLHVANVGDSRLYIVRDGDVTQISQDHSWVQEQVRAGHIQPHEAVRHPRGNVITRWLGQPEVEPDLFVLELEPGDRIVLCTDGLTRYITDRTIRRVVQGQPEQAAAEELIRLANQGGGADNITVVVVRVGEPPDDEDTLPS
jgi:serine/threonine protein phosphatase PrpC